MFIDQLNMTIPLQQNRIIIKPCNDALKFYAIHKKNCDRDVLFKISDLEKYLDKSLDRSMDYSFFVGCCYTSFMLLLASRFYTTYLNI